MRDSAHVALTGTVRPDLPAEDAERIRPRMAICLEGRGEEVSARARAADLGRIYLALNPGGRKIFLEMLACFGIDDSELNAAAQNLLSAADPAAKNDCFQAFTHNLGGAAHGASSPIQRAAERR